MKNYNYINETTEIVIEDFSIERIDSNDLSTESNTKVKDVILLHGFNPTGFFSSNKEMMNEINQTLLRQLRGKKYRTWNISYKTGDSFDMGAQSILNRIAKQGLSFNDCTIIAYSMGGIVARSMISKGFHVKNLITICSPHEGIAPSFFFAPSPGPQSIMPYSEVLHQLNHNKNDINNRHKYYCFGITYEDFRGHHDNDTVVYLESALAKKLNGIRHRERIHLKYGTGAVGFDPHARGKDPKFLNPVFRLCKRLFV